MNTYVITGATGNTGRPTTLELLARGHHVRIISRSADKARELTDRGAELFLGDTRDESLLKSALAGADAIYVVLPMDAQAADYTARQLQDASAIAKAIASAGTRYAVSLSSIGAHLPAGTGVVLGLQHMECLLNRIEGLHVRHLRATYFMENTLGQVQSIKLTGAMGSPIHGAARFPMVAARDICAAVVRNLVALDFRGKSCEYVLGERDLCLDEVATVFGQAIGKPGLKYVAISFERCRQAMLDMGLGSSMVSRLLEFSAAVNDGRVRGFYARTAQGTTATSIETFAHTFRRLYETSPAAA